MQIIGHRGAAGLAPENTLVAFKKALDAKVDWVEFDVHRTVDGQIVVLHDYNTKRISSTNLVVKRSTFAQLRAIKTHSGEQIPTLAEVMKLVGKKAKINIEIKSPGCEQSVAEAIAGFVSQGYNYDHFIVSSFYPQVLYRTQKLDAKIPLALLEFGIPLHLLIQKSLNLKAVGFHHARAPKWLIRRAKKHGLMTYAYTVNNQNEACVLQSLGLDAVVTNYPDRLRVALKASR